MIDKMEKGQKIIQFLKNNPTLSDYEISIKFNVSRSMIWRARRFTSIRNPVGRPKKMDYNVINKTVIS